MGNNSSTPSEFSARSLINTQQDRINQARIALDTLWNEYVDLGIEYYSLSPDVRDSDEVDDNLDQVRLYALAPGAWDPQPPITDEFTTLHDAIAEAQQALDSNDLSQTARQLRAITDVTASLNSTLNEIRTAIAELTALRQAIEASNEPGESSTDVPNQHPMFSGVDESSQQEMLGWLQSLDQWRLSVRVEVERRTDFGGNSPRNEPWMQQEDDQQESSDSDMDEDQEDGTDVLASDLESDRESNMGEDIESDQDRDMVDDMESDQESEMDEDSIDAETSSEEDEDGSDIDQQM